MGQASSTDDDIVPMDNDARLKRLARFDKPSSEGDQRQQSTLPPSDKAAAAVKKQGHEPLEVDSVEIANKKLVATKGRIQHSPAAPLPGQQTTEKKQRRTVSPLRILGPALTYIIGEEVVFREETKAKNLLPTNSSRGIVLPLPFEVSNDEDWEAISFFFVNEVLPNHGDRLQRAMGSTLQDLSKCHERAHGVLRDGWKHYPKNAQLDRCLQALCQQVILSPFVEVLQKDMANHKVGDDEEEAEEDLFEYSSPTEPKRHPPKGAIGDLLTHLEHPIPRVSNGFLKDIVGAFKGKEDLATFLSQDILRRIPTATSSEIMLGRINAVVNLLAVSPTATEAILCRLSTEISLAEKLSGNELENQLWLAPVLSACAYCVPPAGSEKGIGDSIFLNQLQKIPQFPTCVYDPSGCMPYNNARDNGRKTMSSSRDVTKALFDIIFRKAGKARVFQWFLQIAKSNEPMTFLSKPDLLATDGAAGTCCSRPFLLGTSSFLVAFCIGNLVSQVEKKGPGVLDVAYMNHGSESGFFQSTTNPLFMRTKVEKLSLEDTKKFSGATEFFFLSSALLRVSLYPLIRMEDQFLQYYVKVLQSVKSASEQKQSLSSHVVAQTSPIVATWLGFKVFLEDPGIVQNITAFVLLQLEWLLSIAISGDEVSLASIPDWFCKEPCQWLRAVLINSWYQLKPGQADRAIDLATQLLLVGTKSSDFSPIIVTALIRIPAAAVQAGVARAREKERQRRRGRFGKRSEEEDDGIDDDELDIYSSFDRMDLGISVFSNARVQNELCPVLMDAFRSLDIVEGLDVDREHAFDKFSVKLEVTDLFLRLLDHPDGKCRKSVLETDKSRIAQFASSISAAIGYLLDDACLRMADVCKYSLRFNSDFRSRDDTSYEQKQINAATNNFACSRELFKLLFRLSHETSLASVLGGKSDVTTQPKVANDLAVMVIHFLDLMTGEDGGTHPNLEYKRDGSDPTFALHASESIMSESDKAFLARTVVKSRYFARSRIGFDASNTCHQFLALAAKWHFSAAGSNSNKIESPFLLALAAHDDCDVPRYQRILERLIQMPGSMSGSEATNAKAIFKHDGYVDWDAWVSSYEEGGISSEDEKQNRRKARKFQMPRSDISSLSSNESIAAFLADLKTCVDRTRAAATSKVVPEEKVLSIQHEILSVGMEPWDDDEYGKILSEYVVSSSPFSRHGTGNCTYVHHYDSIARRNGPSGSGKALQTEARRCHKTLPVPHANSASFVCFAEERMDLCKAVITGPTETPYALGLFAFDIFYPSQYPRIPPLVTFMTTGGGQTRFGPNLYQDGKVCLSLLGTFNALDDSERWNPDRSSLSQILMSIQTQLFVEDPYFNEPGAERMEGTAAGKDASTRYNANLRLATLRYAIIEPLKHLPLGFEEVALRHFSMCRKRLLVQAKRWVLESQKSSLHSRFERAYAELLHLLSSKEGINNYGALSPLSDDIDTVSRLDPTFQYDDGDDRKPSAVESSSEGEASFNPWARPNASAGMNVGQFYQHDGIEDEELYE